MTTNFSFFTMDLFLSLHSVKDTENESANSISLTLRAKGLVKIQIESPSETTLIAYQYLYSNKIQTDLALNVVTLITGACVVYTLLLHDYCKYIRSSTT